MIRKHWLTWALVGVLILIVGTGLLVKFGMEKAQADEILAKFPDRGVPRMNITLNGVTLEEINAGSKEVKYEGNEVAVYEGDNVILKADGVRVKGRGNATWDWIPDKKPYKIRFNNKIDLFGLGRAKNWNLLANHMDDSVLRNDIAFYVSKMLDMDYAYSGKYVELYIDGEYRGLYYLTRSVEISKTTIDLRNSLGILVELDNIYGELEENSSRTIRGDLITIKEAVSKDDMQLAFDGFMSSFNEFEVALMESNYGKIVELIDVESFAKYYLLSEFTVNPDAYWTSFYFYKDGISDKIHAGPGWDFDFALANRGWANWLGERLYSPTETMVRKAELMPKEFYDENGFGSGAYDASTRVSEIVYDLMEISEFEDIVKKIFQEKMLNRKDELLSYVDYEIELIRDSAISNETLWGRERFDNEVIQLRDWLEIRYDYMESVYK